MKYSLKMAKDSGNRIGMKEKDDSQAAAWAESSCWHKRRFSKSMHVQRVGDSIQEKDLHVLASIHGRKEETSVGAARALRSACCATGASERRLCQRGAESACERARQQAPLWPTVRERERER